MDNRCLSITNSEEDPEDITLEGGIRSRAAASGDTGAASALNACIGGLCQLIMVVLFVMAWQDEKL